jgi:hypothetical protein
MPPFDHMLYTSAMYFVHARARHGLLYLPCLRHSSNERVGTIGAHLGSTLSHAAGQQASVPGGEPAWLLICSQAVKLEEQQQCMCT